MKEKIKKQSENLYWALKDAVLSGEARMGFHRFRNQQVLLDKLRFIGIKKRLLQNTRNFIREQIVTSPKAFDILREYMCIEMNHKGKVWFWDGYSNRKDAEQFHNSEIIFDLRFSLDSVFAGILKGLDEEKGLINLTVNLRKKK